MAKNWKNYYTDNAIHHVTGTVHQWQPILTYPGILSIFYSDFGRLAIRWHVSILGYVVMPEHFHMLVRSEKGDYVLRFVQGGRRSISGRVRKLIEAADQSFSVYCRQNNVDIEKFYRKTAGKSSFRFWKEKPRVFPISREEDVIQKLDYIHNNPLRRRLVKHPEDWKHSSLRFFNLGELVGLPITGGPQDVAPGFHPEA